MIEYALVAGKNFFSTIEPSLIPLADMYARFGLHLSPFESGFVTMILLATVIGVFIMIVTR